MNHRIALPYQVAPTGRTVLVEGDPALAQMLEQIVFVQQGERLNRPEFGCQGGLLVFASGRSEITAAVSALVQSALRQWGGASVEIVGVDVRMIDEVAEVRIDYRSRRQSRIERVVLRNRGRG